MDAFLTLMLTRLRGLSLGTAGLVITVASITWAAGALWQSNRAGHRPLSRLVAIGTVLLLTGQAVASTLWIQVPLIVAYVGWSRRPGHGHRVRDDPARRHARLGLRRGEARLSSVLLMDMLGVATGAGLGGADRGLRRARRSVALGHRVGVRAGARRGGGAPRDRTSHPVGSRRGAAGGPSGGDPDR